MNIFIKKTLTYILPILLIVFITNIICDPASLFRGIEIEIAKNLSNGFNVTGIQNIDERILQKNRIEMLDVSPETIILGSSRIMQVGSSYYGSNSQNNGVSGASLEDIIAIYQLYKDNGIKPQKLVIGIDPWLFNQNNGQSRWLSIKQAYDTYYGKISKNLITNIPIHKYAQLFDLSYFQASIISLPKIMQNITPIATKEEFNNTLTRLIDGTITYGYDYRTKSEGDVEISANSFISGDIYSLENYNELSVNKVQEFESFINSLLNQGIEVDFILMPYHSIVWQYINENIKYSQVNEVEDYIYKYSYENQITITGSYDPGSYMLTSRDFYDGMHLSPEGVKKVLSNTL